MCEYLNACDRDEVFDPPVTIKKPDVKPVEITRGRSMPENAIKVAMITDVHVEHHYTVVCIDLLPPFSDKRTYMYLQIFQNRFFKQRITVITSFTT